jgi:hypothetical protein
MHSEKDLLDEQARVPQRGAAWIAENLLDRLMFGIRSNGTIKELTVRLKEDGRVFPLEWFRGFRVNLWLADDAAITCSVGKVKGIKRKFFYFSLVPSSDCDQAVWGALEEKDIIRIELVAGEEHLLFVWHEDLQLFLRQEVN